MNNDDFPFSDQPAGGAVASCPLGKNDEKSMLLVQIDRTGIEAPASDLEVKISGATSGSYTVSPDEDSVLIENLDAGSYQVSLVLKGDEKECKIDSAHPREITLEQSDSKSLFFKLIPPEVLQLKLINKKDNSAIKGAIVSVTGKSKYSVKTEINGVAEFKDIESASYTVDILLTEEQSGKLRVLDIPDVTYGGGRQKSELTVFPFWLILDEVDHHFVPEIEKGNIEYNISGVTEKDDKVIMKISSDLHNPAIIYERELSEAEKTDGKHTIEWDGKTNCTSGELKGKWINPEYGPYKVTLTCDNISETTETKECNVLYHSISIEQGTYTEDGKAPAEAKNIEWVQYKLNELGYYSGPVDGVLSDQTRRAIKRYTYSSAGYYGNDKEIDDPTNAKFKGQLKSNKGLRNNIEGDSLPLKGKEAKVYIDHDYFYEVFSGADFSHPQGHNKRDEEVLDRFEMPLYASVLMLSRDDADGTGEGINCPEAVGEVDVEWIVKDPDEDTSVLPVFTADIPSRGKAYVDAALAAAGRAPANPEDSQCNCPAGNGGDRVDNAHYFRTGDVLPPFVVDAVGDKVYSKTHSDKSKSIHKLGMSGVLFRGSYIAGDSYVIKAKLSFARHANKANLESAHKAALGGSFQEELSQETGKLTVWRRQRIAAQIDWPSPGETIDWNAIRDSYKSAHCELHTTPRVMKGSDVFPTPADQLELFNLVHSYDGLLAVVDMKLYEDGVYPLPLLPQGEDETPSDYINNIDKKFDILFRNANFQDDLAKLVHKRISISERAGVIIFRANWCRPVPVREKVPFLMFFKRTVTTDYYYSGTCIGLPKGVALIANEYIKKVDGVDESYLQDGFLISHELGHCRYLQHHNVNRSGASTVPDDHDLIDRNCTMCYPWGIGRPGLGLGPNPKWRRGDAEESRFCGKCLLKLRGWDIRKTIPARS